MNLEIEKKYLIKDEKNKYFNQKLLDIININNLSNLEYELRNGKLIEQGYFPLNTISEVSKELGLEYQFKPAEARFRHKGDKYFFTIKSNGELTRKELEKEITKEEFNKYWDLTIGKRVKKIRVIKEYNGKEVDIDFYLDRDLIVAEVEFNSIEEANNFPSLGKDITKDNNYKNKNLAK